MSHTLTISNCRAVLVDRVLPAATIHIEKGIIREIVADASGAPAGFDASGRLVGPGFVDVHCHGDGSRRIFTDPEAVSLNLLRQGATTVAATLGYPDMVVDGLAAQLRSYTSVLGPWGKELSGGVHLEGPYVNRKYGAQTSRGVIKNPDAAEYRALLREFGSLITWWTCAPELPGATAFIREASALGVVVAAGHTEATPDQIAAAIDAGLKVITHWTNATGNPNAAAYKGTRCPGIDEAALVYDELFAEIIPDEKGLHVHPLMAKLLYKAKGPERILIITDAGYGRPDDSPDPPGSRRDVSIDGDGNLAGSRLTMAGAALNFRTFTGCSWPELFRMAALNPARLLGMGDRVGSIEPGKLANLIVFDDALGIDRTYIRGQEVPR
ncbi:MAG: N-acetylglucosamine-6-phosphate deacetylase [Lacunisphaera sp.]|nr:N-acetylglucosamine-6-phosphate deacetylase [Lacunisphaera sp.]